MLGKMICTECNELVKPRYEKEYVGERPHGGYQYNYICPRCGGYNCFTEYTYCEICDKPIPISQDRCDDCLDKMLDEVLERCIEEEKREQEAR